MRRAIQGLLLGLIVLLIVACQPQQQRDLKDVPIVQPEKTELFVNIDQHPNLHIVCLEGVAFVTANRDYKPWNREPDLDKVCAR